MISRRQILSRSVYELSSYDQEDDDYNPYGYEDEDEDVWFNRDRLVKVS